MNLAFSCPLWPMGGLYFCTPCEVRNKRAEYHTNSNFSPVALSSTWTSKTWQRWKRKGFPKLVTQQVPPTETRLEAPIGRMGWICINLMQCACLLCRSWVVATWERNLREILDTGFSHVKGKRSSLWQHNLLFNSSQPYTQNNFQRCWVYSSSGVSCYQRRNYTSSGMS